MEPHRDSKADPRAAAVSRFLNSNSTRKLTREPRPPMSAKAQIPVRLRNGPSTKVMRICVSRVSVLRVVNSVRSIPRAMHTEASRWPSDSSSTRAPVQPGRNSGYRATSLTSANIWAAV